jgi:UV DNA damage endonuclease
MLGYACINESLKPECYRSIRLGSIEKKGINALKTVVKANFSFLMKILEWNLDHEIYFYRVPSNIIPLATHPVVTSQWLWYEDPFILQQLKEIKSFVEEHDMRLSMHPDQFTVINSLREDVVNRSIEYIVYHGQLLKLMGAKDMVLHVGGVYGNKEMAKERFRKNFFLIPHEYRSLIRLENDDKSYNVQDALDLCFQLNIPMIIDLHHHRCLTGTPITSEMLEEVFSTWTEKPKVHISSGRSHQRDRRHSDFIELYDYEWVNMLMMYEIDIMIEAKKKELAVLALKETYET